jgi:hypothetical protein
MPIIGSFGAGSGRGFGQQGASFGDPIVATGGTTYEVGKFKVHVFTGPGTFSVQCVPGDVPGNVDYIVVGGGGGGSRTGGGGGAGGMRYSQEFIDGGGLTNAVCTGYPVAACGSYPISIGSGGAGSNQDQASSQPGTGTSFSPITTSGGGGAANFQTMDGLPGGSGGGGVIGIGGIGNQGGYSPPEGNDGGNGGPATAQGGGGGGANQAGGDFPTPDKSGGDGLYWPGPALCGTCTGESGPEGFYFAGGGAGAMPDETGAGLGGGGCAASPCDPAPVSKGQPNTGGGGGKRANTGINTEGGSGVVIIRYQIR